MYPHRIPYIARLAKRREILIFPRTAGNTGNSREILVIPGKYWEIGNSSTRKLYVYLLTAIPLYLQCKINHYKPTFNQINKYLSLLSKSAYIHAITLLFLRRVCIYTCLSLSISCYNTRTDIKSTYSYCNCYLSVKSRQLNYFSHLQ